MAITVTRVDEDANCQSWVSAHNETPAKAEICLAIGNDGGNYLCLDCARKAFNALGFMIMSATGESLQKLVGLRKGRK